MGIAWGDMFYPGNPERRRRVIQLTQQLYDHLDENFRATNVLSEFLNENITEANFTPVHVDEDQTLKHNCEVLERRVKDIQSILEKIDRMLAERLDTDLYRKLQDPDLSFQDKVETAKKATFIVGAVVATAVAIAVIVAVVSGGFLGLFVAVIGVAATSAAGSVIISAFTSMSIDVIAQAIIASKERKKLEETIKNLEAQLEDFGPASEKYRENVYYVLAELRLYHLQSQIIHYM